MKLIELNKGYFTQVDDEDYERFTERKWHVKYCNKKKSVMGVYREFNVNGVRTYEPMHRKIMNPPPGFQVDHIDRNPLNNQKSNLRICTDWENQLNKKKSVRGKTSRFKGVCRQKGVARWNALIGIRKKRIALGWFDTEEQAAEAYNRAALKYHGQFATLNDLNNPGQVISAIHYNKTQSNG